MKFVHFSDTHLGKSNFKLDERIDDFNKAFKDVMDFCIEKEVDFVIHTGDMFDKAKPDIKVLLFAIKQLKRLKKKGMPFYIVPGSHDVGIEGTFITLLEEMNLLENLCSNKFYSQTEGETLLNGIVIKDVFIAGIPGRRSRIKEIFESIKTNFPEGDYFKIFLFHHIVTDISPLFGDIPLSLLPKGFDYYGGGHWHLKKELKVENRPLIYPGATEFCDVSEMGRERGFYYIENDGELKINFIKLNPRKVVFKEINCENLNPQEVANLCLESINITDSNPLLILKLLGRLKEGKRIEINK